MKSSSRTYRVGCELSYDVQGPSAFIMNLSVAASAAQRIQNEFLEIVPAGTVDECPPMTEGKRQHRFRANAGPLTVRYSADVEVTHRIDRSEGLVEIAPGDLPSEVLPYLYPSRYCESDMLVRLAHEEFGHLPSGFLRVTGICNWVHTHVEYLRGATNVMTSAYDTATERAGVCRDFAHLAIAFCRTMGVPARFVSGYAYSLTPPDFHACFEAYLAGRWYFFDATRLVPQTGFVRIGVGRDAADTSFATIFGPVDFVSMNITMQHLAGDLPEYSVDAVGL